MANRPVMLSLSTLDPALDGPFTGGLVSVSGCHQPVRYAVDDDDDIDDDDLDDDDDDLDDDEVDDDDEDVADDGEVEEGGDDDDLDDDFDDDDDDDVDEDEEDDDLTAQKHTPTRVH
ncbi:MAG: hypothetical protein IT183_08275 [Acidobacteria bacterium]|nr:hypothetical protein [Acidobacteriota bacterium]